MAHPSLPLTNYWQAQKVLFRAATRQLQSKSRPQSPSEAVEWLPDNFCLVSGFPKPAGK
jgi:hypothetical protein